MVNAKEMVYETFSKADVHIGGARPWDVTVHDERFYQRIVGHGSLGLGESYMEGWWDCEKIDICVEKLLRAHVYERTSLMLLFFWLKSKLFNLQSMHGSRKVIEQHYDLSNDLYMSFLDPYNQYTCGYFKDTDDLNVAQIQKMDLICRKLHIEKSDKVLDIGCGWGGFAKYAAETYGCSVTGLTLSKEQGEYAKSYTHNLPVDIQVVDYREWRKTGNTYDKIVVVGMIEHVGYKNYIEFFRIVDELLSEDGLFLLHSIGQNITSTHGNAWSDKYIFPNGMVPSIAQLGRVAEKNFVMEDWHNFGPYYVQTLSAWDENFKKNWPTIKDGYSEVFYRMFRYYFMSFAGGFRARRISLWQIVFSRGYQNKVYHSLR